MNMDAGDFVNKFYDECTHRIDTICGDCMIKMLNQFANQQVENAKTICEDEKSVAVTKAMLDVIEKIREQKS